MWLCRQQFPRTHLPLTHRSPHTEVKRSHQQRRSQGNEPGATLCANSSFFTKKKELSTRSSLVHAHTLTNLFSILKLRLTPKSDLILLTTNSDGGNFNETESASSYYI